MSTRRECIECYELFKPKSPTQKTCSRFCRKVRNDAQRRDRRHAKAQILKDCHVEHALTPRRTKNSGKTMLSTGNCLVCLKRFKAYRRSQVFCSAYCRLLSWTVEALATALKEGTAEGLREKINKLGSGE